MGVTRARATGHSTMGQGCARAAVPCTTSEPCLRIARCLAPGLPGAVMSTGPVGRSVRPPSPARVAPPPALQSPLPESAPWCWPPSSSPSSRLASGRSWARCAAQISKPTATASAAARAPRRLLAACRRHRHAPAADLSGGCLRHAGVCARPHALHAGPGTRSPALVVLCLQVYVSDRNVDEDLVRSIALPAQDPNAAEVFYRIITGG